MVLPLPDSARLRHRLHELMREVFRHWRDEYMDRRAAAAEELREQERQAREARSLLRAKAKPPAKVRLTRRPPMSELPPAVGGGGGGQKLARRPS